MPIPLLPGHPYSEFVSTLDANLAHIKSITNKFQQELRAKRQKQNDLKGKNYFNYVGDCPFDPTSYTTVQAVDFVFHSIILSALPTTLLP